MTSRLTHSFIMQYGSDKAKTKTKTNVGWVKQSATQQIPRKCWVS
jgi:hypothetical protein